MRNALNIAIILCAIALPILGFSSNAAHADTLKKTVATRIA